MQEAYGIVFVGRNNRAKRSYGFSKLAERLSQEGHSVYQFKASHAGGSAEAISALEQLIAELPVSRVHLVAHSAGGITATKISNNPKILSICCLGYPFKHPDRPAENYRIEHLPSVSKPFLIIQGRFDEYGSDPKSLRLMIPDTAQILSLDCDHDYADLSDAQFEEMWTALHALMSGSSGHHQSYLRS